MKQNRLQNTDLSVSDFCYGVMHLGTHVRGDDMFRLYERFREAGGNFFDTAHVYADWLHQGAGVSETSLGACMRHFGDREEVVILTKGGLPACGDFYRRPDDCLAPEVIASDITESLERLQIDTLDIFMLHRDDPRHPVGEIIETLNAEIARGRARYLGASNWSTARIVEANAYAISKGLQGFVIRSPQWNLAQQNHPPVLPNGDYDYAIVPLSDDDVAWHRECRLPVMPWTPTAYGYFAGSLSVNARSFDNPISSQRRERARQLAEKLGCAPIQIALAYLRAHDFPVFPILGTMNLDHLSESLDAARLSLTPEQREWLRTGACVAAPPAPSSAGARAEAGRRT
ncbi:MAG: aldo/keto reductase [Planctomycetes bacterium]|nr:aldo/keto reductase [Planctomycetota bacterium]